MISENCIVGKAELLLGVDTNSIEQSSILGHLNIK